MEVLILGIVCIIAVGLAVSIGIAVAKKAIKLAVGCGLVLVFISLGSMILVSSGTFGTSLVDRIRNAGNEAPTTVIPETIDTVIPFTNEGLTADVRQYVATHGYTDWISDTYVSGLTDYLWEKYGSVPDFDAVVSALMETIPTATQEAAETAAQRLLMLWSAKN